MGSSFAAAFRQPRLMTGSAVLAHLPLLFWLSAVLRPQQSLLAGIGDGTLFLGLAQALEALDMPVDLQGQEARLGAGMLPELRAAHARDYAGLATIAAPGLLAGPVDLLVLDQPDEALVGPLRDLWLPQLSARGAVVILGTPMQIDAASALIGAGMEGVALDFGGATAETGCRIVLREGTRPADLARLVSDHGSFVAARQLFHRLGRGLVAEQAAAALPEALARTARLEAEKTDLAGRAKAAEAEIEDLRRAESLLVRRQAEQVTRLYELELSTREAAALTTRLEAEVDQLRRAHAERIEDIARLTHHFQARAEKLQQDLTVRQERAATQLAQLEDKAKAQLSRLEDKAKAQRKRLEEDLRKEARHELRQERAKRDAMARSTSWRVTRPLRGLRRLIKR